MEYDFHIPVLCKEAIELLEIKPNSICIDMTLGRAGHSSKMLEKIPNGYLYATDKDNDAISYSTKKLSGIRNNFKIYHLSFSKLINQLKEDGINQADCILFDIGVSSPQFDDPSRGFSYRFDSKLDMRMNQEQELTAYKVVNTYSEEELRHIISYYGEDPNAYKIAKQIVKNRQIQPIETTFQLVDTIKQALPSFILNKKGHPAKQTFQAIRYEVNNEIYELENGLKEAIEFLSVGGHLAIITFNSLEDKIVKDIFKSYTTYPSINRNLPPVLNQEPIKYSLITRKPIVPSQEELKNNPRSEPSKLRVIERIIK
jgi:16S rRNA (cytosine1402-N4)-methyltransferase